MARGKLITAEEIETIKKLAADHTIYEIMDVLKRPYASINTAMNRHGIQAVKKQRQHKWTTTTLKEFLDYYNQHGKIGTAAHYGMQASSVKGVLLQCRSGHAKKDTRSRTGEKRMKSTREESYVTRASNQRIAASNALERFGIEGPQCVTRQFKTIGVKVMPKSKTITVEREKLAAICCLADEVVSYLESLVGSSNWNEQDCGAYSAAQTLVEATNTIMDEKEQS